MTCVRCSTTHSMYISIFGKVFHYISVCAVSISHFIISSHLTMMRQGLKFLKAWPFGRQNTFTKWPFFNRTQRCGWNDLIINIYTWNYVEHWSRFRVRICRRCKCERKSFPFFKHKCWLYSAFSYEIRVVFFSRLPPSVCTQRLMHNGISLKQSISI